MSLPRAVTSVRALKVRRDRAVELPEHVVTESPMQILLGEPAEATTPLAVTMRTPGHDFELAAGFVVSEGVAPAAAITSVTYCDDPAILRLPGAAGPLSADSRFNHVTVRLAAPRTIFGQGREFTMSASCGVCGKTSIDQVQLSCAPPGPADPIGAGVLFALPAELRRRQAAFERTGGLHAAGLFDPNGAPWCVREDVGRHNAVDKVVGWLALGARGKRTADAPGAVPTREELAGWVLMVSGRVSFEIVQKAAVAGIGTLAAISAPSSLAVEAAARLQIGLVGFLRDNSFNVYACPERVAPA
jgi:FdhD protein